MRPNIVEEGEEIPVTFLGVETKEVTVWRSGEVVLAEDFPPCIRNIMTQKSRGKGGNRASAVLAAFLGQVGWPEDEARALWSRVVEEMGLAREARIFEKWYHNMHCPSCKTIKTDARGYPHLGLAGLDYCQPDGRCAQYKWPVGYATGVSGEEEADEAGWRKPVRRVRVVRLYDWLSGAEFSLELSDEELRALEDLLSSRVDEQLFYTSVRVKGMPRPRFLLKLWEVPRRWVLSEKF